MLLSRVAERVYWQARYLERVENTARLLNVFSTLLMDLPPNTKLGWGSLVQITGTEELYNNRYKQAIERNVMRFLIAEDNGVSIADMLALVRENARTTREIMPAEAFERINNLYFNARDKREHGVDRGRRHEFLEGLIADCQQISGLLAGTMSRGQAYSFIRLGRSLERADMTTRIVDVGSGNLLPAPTSEDAEPEAKEPYENILWMNILRAQSGYQMYRQHVKERINAADVVRFMLQNEDFPRSASHNLTTLTKVLVKLPNHSKVAWQVNKTRRLVRDADIEKLLKKGLVRYTDDLQKEIAAINFKIAEAWFLPAK